MRFTRSVGLVRGESGWYVQRTTPEVMRLRAATVELPFTALKYLIFRHPRFLLRSLAGAQTEISLATLVYNLKRMLNILGGIQLR